jgi:hypothetical protein
MRPGSTGRCSRRESFCHACDLVLHRVAEDVPGVLVEKVSLKHPRQIGQLLLELQNSSAEEIERLIAHSKKSLSGC